MTPSRHCSVRAPRPTTRSGSASRSGARPRRWTDLMAAGERVEALGFASLFANDHLMPILGDADGPVLGSTGPVFEGWMTLGAWAARTTPDPARRDGLRGRLPERRADGQDGDRARPRQRRPRDARASAPAGTSPSTGRSATSCSTLGDRISRFDEASRLARGMLDGGAMTPGRPLGQRRRGHATIRRPSRRGCRS